MFNGLGIQLLVVILLLAVILQLVITIFVGQRTLRTLEQQALISQRRVVTNVRSNISAYVQEHKNELELLEEGNGLGILDVEAQQMILKNLLESQRVFHKLIANLRFKPVWDLLASLELPNLGDAYVLDPGGQVIAHRSPDIVLRSHIINLMAEEGRGLGLAKVKDIVTYYGGWIEVEREIDRGSTCSVYLPARMGHD